MNCSAIWGKIVVMQKSDKEWKELLSPEQFNVLRKKQTEPAFSGDLLYQDDHGIYSCVACGAELFASEHKFDSGSGWPSFYSAIDNSAVTLHEDRSHEMRRVEVRCANCGGHLGHVFNDAPNQPTGIRFCVNSLSLDFEPN